MTIQEYKDAFEYYITVLSDTGATADMLYGARVVMEYAVILAREHLINVDISVFDFNELKDGKCYTVGINTDEINPLTANKFIHAMKDAVADRGITLVPVLKQMEIKEVDKEVAK